MGLDLLDTPVRITWDLHGPAGRLDREPLLTVAERLVDGGVFFVTLDARPFAHPDLAALLARLGDGGCQVQAVCGGAADELPGLAQLASALPTVYLDIDRFVGRDGVAAAALDATLKDLRAVGCEPALALVPLRRNLAALPALFRLAPELGVAKIKLPNARLGDSVLASPIDELPRAADLAVFRTAFEASELAGAALPALEIHDLFLWEILTPGFEQARSEYGGCQAGNSLGHVTAAGLLTPCSAWPLPLGSLLEHGLAELWQTPARFAMRAQAGAVPPGCVGCSDLATCRGGCRGLASHLNQSAGERDLMCRAPRPGAS